MAMPKPTVLLIPGLWHTPEYFNALRIVLEKHSYETISRQLPSVDCDDPSNHSAQSDADFIRSQLLLPLLDNHKRVVVVMHSYGGMPGSAAAYALSEEERSKEGLKGGVVGLVYIAAFVVPAGKTCADMKPPPLAGFEMKEDVSDRFSPVNVVNASGSPRPFNLTIRQGLRRPMNILHFETSGSSIKKLIISFSLHRAVVLYLPKARS